MLHMRFLHRDSYIVMPRVQLLGKGMSTKFWPEQVGLTCACGVYVLWCVCSKPKVCAYLERTYMARDKKRPDVKTLKVSDVWADVKETFALTMLRYHSKSPQELRPYIKASDPAFMAGEPWANLLWLGLGAPLPIFLTVRVHAMHWMNHSCTCTAVLTKARGVVMQWPPA